MLAEMGVTVWWPTAADAAVVEAPVAAPPPVRQASPTVAMPAPAPRPVPAARPVAEPTGAIGERPAGIAAMHWPQLQAAVSGCTACALSRTRTQTVFGVGPAATDEAPPQVDWLVVGEAPGEQEDKQGEPFVGQAGKLLDNMLKAIGLSRMGAAPLRGAYIANVIKCRPPGNRNPAVEEIAQCTPYLERQIALLRPKVIIAVGRFAMQALLAETVPDVATRPLGRLRGTVHRWRDVPVVVTYHPAYLLRTPADKAKSWADLCLALATAAGESTPP